MVAVRTAQLLLLPHVGALRAVLLVVLIRREEDEGAGDGGDHAGPEKDDGRDGATVPSVFCDTTDKNRVSPQRSFVSKADDIPNGGV